MREAAGPAGAAPEHAGGRLEAAAVVVPERDRRRGWGLPPSAGRVRTTSENVVLRGERERRDAMRTNQPSASVRSTLFSHLSWVLHRHISDVHFLER